MLSLWTDSLFDDFHPRRNALDEWLHRPLWSAQRPAADVHQHDDHVEIQMDLPGLQHDDLKIEAESGVLIISGTRELPTAQHRWSGSFERRFRLSRQLDPDAIEAKLEAGVLSVRIPKRPEAQPKTIKIG